MRGDLRPTTAGYYFYTEDLRDTKRYDLIIAQTQATCWELSALKLAPPPPPDAAAPAGADAATAPASAETATVPPSAYPATAPPVRVNKIAVAGNTLIIGHFASANPDCTASGKTFVRVSRNPSHGVVTMREGLGFSNFPKLPECNSHKMEGVTVEYTPYDGFTDQTKWNLTWSPKLGTRCL